VAKIIAGISSSHVPAIGAAIDNKQTEEPYWKRVFAGFEKSKQWMAQAKPDVVIAIYNDHASAFSVEMIPTFAIGLAWLAAAAQLATLAARRYAPYPNSADRGLGPIRAALRRAYLAQRARQRASEQRERATGV